MTGRAFSFSSFVVVAALLLAAGIAGCSIPATQATTPTAQAPVHVTVLHTNDHHGRFWRSRDNEYGLAARKTLIDRVRAEVAAQGGHVLLLDAGDVNTGVPESDLQGAEPDFRGMSLLGYDAMAVGNHEFDRPPEVMARQRNEWSRFTWLSANVYRNGERLFDPYKLFALGPLRVAVMGLTTEDTASMGAAKRYPGVSFASPVDEARSVVPQLRQRADVVIALTHMGHYPNGAHGTAAAGDVELARAVPGIDLVVGGHSHSLVCMLAANVRTTAYEPGSPCAPDRQNGAWIVQAGDWGRFVGRADFEWHPAGTLRLLRYTLLPVNLRQGPSGVAVLPEDPQALALLQPFQQRGEVGMSAPVGRSSGRFEGDRALVRARPAALGVLITRAMRERTGADVAIISGGGIRDSLPEGVLTYRDILKIQPFGNEIVVVTLQGSELAAYLSAAARMSPGTGAYPQSTGLGVDADGTVRVQGRPLDVQRNYRLALTGFVARGGDGYPDLSSHPGFTATGLIDAQVLREFIAGRALLQPAEFEPMRGAWPSAHDTP